jgi:hypothetical protein
MSDIKIKLILEPVWSIDNVGYLELEVTPKGDPKRILGSFKFDEETIIESLEEDLEIRASDPTYDLTDWFNLKHRLEEIAEAINDKLEDVLQ